MTTTTTTTVPAATLLAGKPGWAVKALVAEFVEDVSDIRTDYFATRTTRTVFLGWSRTTRDNFAEMRKAAVKFADTAHLATAPKTAEHREKYSMGHGYYLKATSRYGTGWEVRKVGDWAFRGDVERIDPATGTAALAAAIEAPAPVTVPTMTLNAAKGGVELRFPAKPAEAVRSLLKGNGWRWSGHNGCWYKRHSAEAVAFAETLVKAA